MVTTTSREIGTLVVVILKAKNLPNKRHIGKQDPYCSVTFNGEKKRTKAIKRGGQHPEWDEEFRYTLYEDPNDALALASQEDGTPPPPPPKNNKGPPSVKGGRSMSVACYAEDPREPDFIGEAIVDLTEVLTKGETDEWFTITSKEKYCGEVYLELTFWSNEPVPIKKATSTSNGKGHKQYGGPGQFVPVGESPPPNGVDIQEAIRSNPTGSSRGELRPDRVPPSLRPSSSRVDLYVPPYETSRSRHSVADSITSDFAELSVGHGTNRRLSFPPQQSSYAPRPASSIGFQDQQPSQLGHSHHQGTYADGGGYYSEGSATPPTATTYHQGPPLEQYQPPYETLQPVATGYQVTPRHGPRHSLPPASSGFMPMPTPAPSGFVPLSSHHSQPSGFAPLSSATPAPQNYGPPAPHMAVPSSSFSMLSQPPIASSGFVSTGPPPTPSPYHRSSLPQPPQPQSAGSYHSLHIPPPLNAPQPPLPPVSAPPGAPSAHQTYVPPPPPPSVSHHSHSAPPEQYAGHHLHQSTSLEHIPPPPPLHDSPPSGQPSGSRPLPQPTQSSQQHHRRRQSSLPIPPAGGPPGMYNPPHPSGSFNLPPPAPQAGPPMSYSGSATRATSGSYAMYPQGGLYTQPTGSSTLAHAQSQAQSVPYNGTSGVGPGDVPSSLYNSIPPPPPLPPQTTPAPYSPHSPQPPPAVAATSPSLPPPPSQYQPAPMPSRSPSLPAPPHNISRRPSLPPPPTVAYASQLQSVYQALPPPPAPPSMPANAHYEPSSSYMPMSNSQTFHPGPPPRPPTQPNGQPQYLQYPLNQQVPYGDHSPVAETGW